MRFLTNLGSKNSSTPDEDKIPQMVRNYFAFLVEQYGLRYDGRTEFTSSRVRIQVEVGHKSPRIVIYRVSEPEFTRLIFERVVQYLERTIAIDHLFIDYLNHPLEHNISFLANLFQRYAERIIEQIEEWWIPAQVFQYNLIKKEYEEAGQLEDFDFGFRNKTDYLKSKGAL